MAKRISDELREWGYGFCGDTYDVVTAIADRIDSEMVELPKDAHGECICVGDTLDGYGKTIEVVEMRYVRGGWVLISRDGSGYADTFAFAHTRPDSLERIADELDEMVDAADSADDRCEKLADLAERIRRLAKEDDK